MRLELTTRSLEDLQRSREYWQAAEEKQCFLDKREEAWELSRSQVSLRPKTRKEFENYIKRNVMPGPFRDSKENQKSLQKWTDELRRNVHEEERRLEREKRDMMEQEDFNSWHRRLRSKAWEQRELGSLEAEPVQAKVN